VEVVMENQDHETLLRPQIIKWIEDDILNGDIDPETWIEDLYRYLGGVLESDEEDDDE
tara:strand:- start:7686 stop:7859 length:174 start_codon:yes stop_codon:yes gene_type:complete